jgi:outer membrane receptor protein involved in Fe transport
MSASALAFMAAGGPGFAQVTQGIEASSQEGSPTPLEEVVVTARKREETLTQTPVNVQVVTQEDIQAQHIDSTVALTGTVPDLMINTGFALNGVTINFRGLGNGSAASFIDQSLALNLDGFTSSSGQLYLLGLFDMNQIEFLKGPQALYYGKSTSAGLITISTADPTTTWDSALTAGHEFNANETDFDGFISGPLTDDLGIRIAYHHVSSDGYLYNPNPAAVRDIPDGEDDAARLTLAYSPIEALRVKFKASVDNSTSHSWIGDTDETLCQPGLADNVPIYNIYNQCGAGPKTRGDLPSFPYNPGQNYAYYNTAAFLQGEPSDLFGEGPHTDADNKLGLLNVEYDVAHGLTLSSLTAIALISATSAGDSGSTSTPLENGVAFGDKLHEFSEEVRLASSWTDRWYNFVVGGLYNPSNETERSSVVTPEITGLPGFSFYSNDSLSMKSKVDSAFGQVLLTPIEHWELDAGVRYIHTYKHLYSIFNNTNYPSFFFPTPNGQAIQDLSPSHTMITENATLPEVTLSYKPTSDLNVFATYKKGYKGPGFNAAPGEDSNIDDTSIKGPFAGERVEGEEAGIKGRYLGGSLALSLTGYLYKYSDLQVGIPNALTNQEIVENAASARVQGFDIDALYNVPVIPGFKLNAAAEYNDSHFINFANAPCWSGQPISAGCDYAGGLSSTPAPEGVGTQNLSGRTLSLAPRVSGTVGATYTRNWNSAVAYSINASANFSSDYLVSPELNPLGRQSAYALANVVGKVMATNGSWEVALICRDCNNQYYIVNGSDEGNGFITNTFDEKGNVTINVARPRQILLQFTVRPFHLF